MKADEYFKKVGIRAVKETLDIHGWRNTPFAIQLKRLVEPHELIEGYGGINQAKNAVAFRCNDSTRLKQAIADVESCL